MAKRRVKVQEGENLSESNIEKVIELLSDEKPITKKAACEILNITYNTTRLKSIIDQHVEDKVFKKDMRKRMRSQPIDKATASQIVSSYLSGNSLAEISEETYRSTSVVKTVLRRYNVPVRNKSVDYFHPVFIENDEAIRDDYATGDLVYSARYDCPVTIIKGKDTTKHGKVFTIQIHGSKRRQAAQPYYELADLRKVQQELHVEMKDLDKEDVKRLLWEGMKNQKKQEDKRK